MCLCFILRVTVEESVFWMYWHQYIVTIWVTRQPTDRWGCSVSNTRAPLSSTLRGRGCLPRAGSRSRSWYLTRTLYGLWIPPLHVPLCSDPSTKDWRLTLFGRITQRSSHWNCKARTHPLGTHRQRHSQRKATTSVGCYPVLENPGPKTGASRAFTAWFCFQVSLGAFLPFQGQAKACFLFQITAAVVSSEGALGRRKCFRLLSSPHAGARAEQKVREKPSTGSATTCMTTLPPQDAALPGSKITWGRGGRQVRCFLNSFLSNNTQTERSESGGPTAAYAHLFMKTLSVDLVSSRQSSRGACLFKSVSSQVKFVALMNGRAEPSIKGQRKITLICIQ